MSKPTATSSATLAIAAILGLAAYIGLQLPQIASGLAGGGASLTAHTAGYVAAKYAGYAAQATMGAAGLGLAVAQMARDSARTLGRT